MKIITFYLVLCISFCQCNEPIEVNYPSKPKVTLPSKSKKVKEGAITLKKHKKCESGLEVYGRSRDKIEMSSVQLKPNLLNINFNFVENCCYEYRASYVINEDTIVIKLKEINEVACGCLCCRNYALTISNFVKPYNTFKVFFEKNEKLILAYNHEKDLDKAEIESSKKNR